MSRIAIIDSSVYITLFRTGRYQEELKEICRYFLVRNSSVVLLELFAGALERDEKKLVRKMQRDFGSINPTTGDWIESAQVLNRLKTAHGFESRKMRDLVNDTLIAISARRNGAFVITSNQQDFRLIQETRHFDLIVLK